MLMLQALRMEIRLAVSLSYQLTLAFLLLKMDREQRDSLRSRMSELAASESFIWQSGKTALRENPGKDNLRFQKIIPLQKAEFLQSPRVCRLQGRVIQQVLRQHYGINPSGRDIRILSRISSAAWICRQLNRAAGVSGWAQGKKERDRVRFVFKAFVRGLEFDRSSVPRRTRRLFPTRLAKEWKRFDGEEKMIRHYQQKRMNHLCFEVRRFAQFVEFQTLPASSAVSEERINRYFKYLSLTSVPLYSG